jgi:phage tail-like protein
VRNDDQNALRNIVIHLQNEDHTSIAQTWKLHRARLVKHVSGLFNAQGCDVAMEELTLAYELSSSSSPGFSGGARIRARR